MFTSIDKAIVALIGALIYLATEFALLPPGFVPDDLVQSIAVVVTAVLVYLVPNKEKRSARPEHAGE